MTEHRWQGYSHKELYECINAGPGAGASHASTTRWSSVSAALAEINDDLHLGIRHSGARWQGRAAEQAEAGLNPLAAWADNARLGADVMRYSAELQADHISKARADMPAPVNVTAEQPNSLVTGLTHLFGGQTDHEKQEEAQDAAERRAREVMTTYASSTTANTSSLGQFTQPPQLQLNVSGMTTATGPGVAPAGAWVTGPHGATGGALSRSSSRGRTVAPPPQRTASPPPGPSTRTSGVSSTPATTAKGVHNTTSVSSTTPTGSAATGTAGAVPGQRTSRSSSSSGKQAEADTTSASSVGAAPLMGSQTSGVTSSAPSSSVMGPQGTMGASNNDQVHRRAVPMPPAFDPFGGMGGARTAAEEEDTPHKAADYLRETDDIYGVGHYSAPVIGESTTD